MASVSSLDQDLKNLRLSKYTPQASSAVVQWISSTLGETFPSNKDLMDLLHDGSILCRLANHLGDKQIRHKASAMPFVQRENISHFLTFVSTPPISLPPHDRFLTVDLFDKKDPAQVVQCLSAFSRAAHAINPSRFPDTIGGLKGGVSSISPQQSGSTVSRVSTPGSSTTTTKRSTPTVTSWSKKEQEGVTTPAWNIHQYGYMGGSSQNDGISFGARRQITQTPVISDFDKRRAVEREEREKLRRQQEQEAAELRKKQQALAEREAAVRRIRAEDAEREERERREAEEEERRTRKSHNDAIAAQAAAVQKVEKERVLREREMREAHVEVERKRAFEERRAKQRQQAEQDRLDRLRMHEIEEEERRQQEADEARRAAEHRRQMQREQDPLERERERVRQLERELKEARERERLYAAARAELVWDSAGTGRVTAQPFGSGNNVTGQGAESSGSRTPDIPEFEIPKRKLPTPPPLKSKPTLAGRVQVQDREEARRVASWEAGDDKHLDGPSKSAAPAPPMKWASRQENYGAKREAASSPPPPPMPPRKPQVPQPVTTGNGFGQQQSEQKPMFKPMSFLEREREQERLRLKKWEHEHMGRP